MGLQPLDIIEHSHAHDLQLVLRTTHSFLAFHTPYIRDGKSLRILDLALLNAIADLEQVGAPPPDDGPTVQRALKGA